MKKDLNLLREKLKMMDEIFRSIEGESSQNFNEEGFNLIEAIIKKEIVEDVSWNFLNSFNASLFRNYAIQYMGFALITKKFVRDLSKYIGDNKCLEIMSGQGCLSKSLRDEGIDIIATDNYSWDGRIDMSDLWTDIEKIDCLDAIRKYGKDVSYIICSWIPYENPIGYEALKLMNEVNSNCRMIVIGEGYGGCTADDLFFENLEEIEINEEFTRNFRSWNCIHDYVSVIKFKSN